MSRRRPEEATAVKSVAKPELKRGALEVDVPVLNPAVAQRTRKGPLAQCYLRQSLQRALYIAADRQGRLRVACFDEAVSNWLTMNGFANLLATTDDDT